MRGRGRAASVAVVCVAADFGLVLYHNTSDGVLSMAFFFFREGHALCLQLLGDGVVCAADTSFMCCWRPQGGAVCCGACAGVRVSGGAGQRVARVWGQQGGPAAGGNKPLTHENTVCVFYCALCYVMML